jgi:4-hydroxy-3-methylbut-2-enyl diphosphate reductase
MLVLRAKVLGFCMGVRRAVKIASNQIACNQIESPPLSTLNSQLSTPLKRVYTLGPLLHNPHVLEDLKRQGVEILDEAALSKNNTLNSQLSTLNSQLPTPHSLSDAVVIIRAHGISPQTEAELRKRGAVVVDATCPKVKASQLKAASLAKQGYRLFLAGEESHAEIAGIRGYAQDAAQDRQFLRVVNCAAQARESAAGLFAEDQALQKSQSKTALLAQTTISADEYRAIGEAILQYFPALEIVQTICAATGERQDSLRELLEKADAVVIAGGKDSANTRRLLAIAQTAGKPCAIVETAVDIPPEFLRFETVGLAAGASTPDTVIDAIEQALEGKK